MNADKNQEPYSSNIVSFRRRAGAAFLGLSSGQRPTVTNKLRGPQSIQQRISDRTEAALRGAAKSSLQAEASGSPVQK